MISSDNPLSLCLKVLLLVLFLMLFATACGRAYSFNITVDPKEDVVVEEIGRHTITAYTLTIEQTDDTPCISASGLDVCKTDKLICACPREYEFRTKFLIDGQVYHCEDRLSEKYDYRFDILMNDYDEALEWGKQILLVKRVIK